MSTPINVTVNARFESSTQPASLFTGISSLEDGVTRLLELATSSQKKLVRFMDAIVANLKSQGIESSYYDPGIKSFDSAVRKAKKGYGTPNQIRLLTDPYRASMIVEQKEGIKMISDFIKSQADAFKFKIVYDRDTFNQPWSDGYRDINYKFADMENQGLVGELQIQLCGIKKFTELAGHKAYEIARELPRNDPTTPIIKKALESVTHYGYNKSANMKNIGCLENIKSLHGGKRRKTRQTKKHRKARSTRRR
jgi:predicted acetyltransferase